MMMKAEQLEKAINSLLQQRVNFSINNKIIKSGKLILFCIKDFYLVFTISVNHSKKMFEIPYPYLFDQYAKKIILNYDTTIFHHGSEKIMHHAKQLMPKKPGKFFNTQLEINVIEDAI
jgi:hypothetical protein